jgi:hypothetical protein
MKAPILAVLVAASALAGCGAAADPGSDPSVSDQTPASVSEAGVADPTPALAAAATEKPVTEIRIGGGGGPCCRSGDGNATCCCSAGEECGSNATQCKCFVPN